MNKNRFEGAQFDDSDDEVVAQKTTKTQKKKEDRKITEKPIKVNTTKMAEGGFEVVSKDPTAARPQTASRGGRGGERGRGGRGGRGGDRGGRGGAPRPVRMDADGNPIGAGDKPRERRPFAGKPREEAHPMDKHSGAGRGRRAENKRDGHGKGNWGDKEEVAYKKKGEAGEEEEKVTEKKVEEPKVIVKEEIVGVSIDDFFAGKDRKGKAEARATEGIKGAKVEQNQGEKVHQSTVMQNQYLKGVAAKTADVEVAKLTGFGSIADEDFSGDNRGDRGDRRGGRGGRGGARGGAADAQKGGRRQNPRQALKKTEEDFPTL
jgi:hypothetical protein